MTCFLFDAEGRNVYGSEYPADALTGHGSISGHFVKCVSPEWLVKFHTGYPLDETDYRDVLSLCRRFGIELPAEYRTFGGA